MLPTLKNNAAAGYQGPVKIELLKSAGLLRATCTVCNVLHGWSREQKNEQHNNAPNPTKQCSCRLPGSSENRDLEILGLVLHLIFLAVLGKTVTGL